MRDDEIVALYWQRSEDAIRETAAKYHGYLTGIARRVLSDAEDSEECVNDTYLAAWNSMPEHRPDVLSTYLGKITRQISIDVFRKRSSRKRYASEYALSLSELEDSLSGGSMPEQVFDEKQLDAAVNAFVRSLPERTRRVFIGRYYFFDPVKTVAAYCGVSESSAKSILFRTRLRLKEYLEKEGFNV